MVSIAVAPGAFAAWAWRVPFLASSHSGGRRRLRALGVTESPVFHEDCSANAARGVCRCSTSSAAHGRTVLLAAGSYVGTARSATWGWSTSSPTRHASFGLPLPTRSRCCLAALWLLAGSIVVFAIWSDRIRPARIMRGGWRARALVADLLSTDRHGIASADRARAVRDAVAARAYIGTQPAVFAELFPTAVRYSGASLSLRSARSSAAPLRRSSRRHCLAWLETPR